MPTMKIWFAISSYFFLIQIYDIISIAYHFSLVRYIQFEDYNLYINTKNLGTIYFLGNFHSQVPEKRKIGSFNTCFTYTFIVKDILRKLLLKRKIIIIIKHCINHVRIAKLFIKHGPFSHCHFSTKIYLPPKDANFVFQWVFFTFERFLVNDLDSI